MLGARYGVGRSRHDGERFATVSRGVGMTSTRSPRIEIEYCTGCRWGLRAGWVAQELLVTFEAELGEVALVPGRQAGVFVVRLDGEAIFDRGRAGRFPELRELKQAIRDRVAPGRSLGHSERAVEVAGSAGENWGGEEHGG